MIQNLADFAVKVHRGVVATKGCENTANVTANYILLAFHRMFRPSFSSNNSEILTHISYFGGSIDSRIAVNSRGCVTHDVNFAQVIIHHI